MWHQAKHHVRAQLLLAVMCAIVDRYLERGAPGGSGLLETLAACARAALRLPLRARLGGGPAYARLGLPGEATAESTSRVERDGLEARHDGACAHDGSEDEEAAPVAARLSSLWKARPPSAREPSAHTADSGCCFHADAPPGTRYSAGAASSRGVERVQVLSCLKQEAKGERAHIIHCFYQIGGWARLAVSMDRLPRAQVYGKKTAVRDLSLELRQGEILALLGHNGAGAPL